MYQTLLYTEENHIATVTINRPEYGNAFSEETYEEIIDVMNKIDENDQIDVAILTGAGKYFCSGGDIRYFQKMIDNEIGRASCREREEMTVDAGALEPKTEEAGTVRA